MSEGNGHKSVTILALAILGFSIFQMTQILADRGNLGKAEKQVAEGIAQADKILAENQKMLDQLNAIAVGTQKLADAGNTNAKDIVAQLGRLGIRINANFKAGQPPEQQAAPTPGMPGMMPTGAAPPSAPPPQ